MFRFLSVVFTLVMFGCSEPDAPADPRTLAQAALDIAQSRYQLSQERGFAWRNARERLEQAQVALKENDFEAALREAEAATELAEASIAQADAEALAWHSRAPFGS